MENTPSDTWALSILPTWALSILPSILPTWALNCNLFYLRKSQALHFYLTNRTRARVYYELMAETAVCRIDCKTVLRRDYEILKELVLPT